MMRQLLLVGNQLQTAKKNSLSDSLHADSHDGQTPCPDGANAKIRHAKGTRAHGDT